jgi:hypothetical protein
MFQVCSNLSTRAGQGNLLLEGALPLARSLHQDIVRLGRRLDNVVTAEEQTRPTSKRSTSTVSVELTEIMSDMKSLLLRIDKDTPALQLAISVSGESLATSFPVGLSPSRLLQSSILLTMGDTQYAQTASRPIQVGPEFIVTVYMLFSGHSSTLSHFPQAKQGESLAADLGGWPGRPSTRPSSADQRCDTCESDRKPLWQEVMHKARARLCRTPVTYIFDTFDGYIPQKPRNDNSGQVQSDDGYAYHLELIEDLDDGRVHNCLEGDIYPRFDTIEHAGIRESLSLNRVSKLFYTDRGKILNIGDPLDENNPVLLLKREVAIPTSHTSPGIHTEVFETRGKSQRAPKPHQQGRDSTNNLDYGTKAGLCHGYHVNTTTRPGKDRRPVEPKLTGSLPRLRFPPYLDPEWVALEAYDCDVIGSNGSSHGDSDDIDWDSPLGNASRKNDVAVISSPLDSNLVSQIRNFASSQARAVRTNSSPEPQSQSATMPDQKNLFNYPSYILSCKSSSSAKQTSSSESENRRLIATSTPFKHITTTLSLLEMLVRLASLQQFQQASHLSIPDYILTFFLEEASTTGLHGEASWDIRRKTKEKVGFDPYTDTPANGRPTT